VSQILNKFRQNHEDLSETDSDEQFVEQIDAEDQEELEMIKELNWICPECSASNENNIVCHRCFHINKELLEKAEDDEIQIENPENIIELMRNSWMCPKCASRNYPVSQYCEKCYSLKNQSQSAEIQLNLKQGLRYCIQCGNFVKIEYFWCEECGFPLKLDDLRCLAVCPNCKSLYIQHGSCRNCGFD
jgi:predicted Zn-ribbon and HTH transcriptional regulator